MNRFVLPCLLCLSACLHAETIRSNGKGGGPWSAPATWQGGKVPSGGPVSILSRDIVDLDAAARPVVACEELVIDPKGVLRVAGANKAALTLTIRKSLHVFGGMLVDLSKDPDGRFECVWTNADPSSLQILLGEGGKIAWKGATGATPNVVFRVDTNAWPATAAPTRLVPLTLGGKMSVECEGVTFEGFDVQATGIDGSGIKFNERLEFRRCHFVRSPVTINRSTKIEFHGNRLTNSPVHCLSLYAVTHSRFTSNTMERAGHPSAVLVTYGVGESEISANRLRHGYYGMNLVSSSDLILRDNRIEETEYGLFLNSCSRITGHRLYFSSNSTFNLAATFASPVDPYRFFDCTFANATANTNYASVQVSGACSVDLVNTPLQSHDKAPTCGPLLFSAYADIFVTNEQGAPLGRVLLRVLSGARVIATSRTEAIGARAGHTPLPSSHRPLVIPWYRFAPQEGETNPATSRSYTLEVDGSHLGYQKQSVPLVVDETWLRPDPEKPTKTITVKLARQG